MDYSILFAVLSGIAILLFLILYLKVQAFISLLLASITVGFLAGMSGEQVIKSIQEGMGGTLGFIAIVVGLGAIFGAILENSGGVHALADYILNKSGPKRASTALMLTGFLISIPVFFDVGFVILVPVIYALQKKTGKSLLYYGIPLLAGLAVTHAFIPPTPGPVAVADILGADLGLVIFIGILAGIPSAILAGPVFGRYIATKIDVAAPFYNNAEKTEFSPPSPFLITTLIGIPLVLILISTIFNSSLGENLQINQTLLGIISTLGHPFIALIIANFLAWYFLGIRRKFSRNKLLEISSKSLGPAGIIILITGAGGAFKQILTETGAGQMLAVAMVQHGFPLIFFAFISAAVVRILQGSSTVAMITAAGMTASLLEGSNYSNIHNAILVISIASGATIMSHVNDSGFWLVNKYFGLSEKQTLKSWTVMTTIIALTSFTTVLIVNYLFS